MAPIFGLIILITIPTIMGLLIAILVILTKIKNILKNKGDK